MDGALRRLVGPAEGVGMLPAAVKPGPAFALEHDDNVITHYTDRTAPISSFRCLAIWAAVFLAALVTLIVTVARAKSGGESGATTVFIMFSSIAMAICLVTLLVMVFTIAPNEGVVLTRFGSYIGTVKHSGVHVVPPWYIREKISFRLKNFVSETLKCNDIRGNPIKISGVIVWSVVDAAKARFSTTDLDSFVTIQSEGAIRNIAARYPYDSHVDGETSLLSNSHDVRQELQDELHARLGAVGIVVHEAQIVQLAYADEIASSMLQRQMAGAVVAARAQIVTGAVLMVEDALGQLQARGICELAPAERTRLISNLLTVLCGDSRPQATVTVGAQ